MTHEFPKLRSAGVRGAGKVARVSNPVKKGNFVALQTHHTTFYAFGSGKPSEPREDWQIVQVMSASREGVATRIQYALGGATDVKHIHGRPKIHTMAKHQKGAAALFESGKVWHSADQVRSAVLAAEGIETQK